MRNILFGLLLIFTSLAYSQPAKDCVIDGADKMLFDKVVHIKYNFSAVKIVPDYEEYLEEMYITPEANQGNNERPAVTFNVDHEFFYWFNFYLTGSATPYPVKRDNDVPTISKSGHVTGRTFKARNFKFYNVQKLAGAFHCPFTFGDSLSVKKVTLACGVKMTVRKTTVPFEATLKQSNGSVCRLTGTYETNKSPRVELIVTNVEQGVNIWESA